MFKRTELAALAQEIETKLTVIMQDAALAAPAPAAAPASH
jgi:hypothetical protein